MSEPTQSPFRLPVGDRRGLTGALLRGGARLVENVLQLPKLEALWRAGGKAGSGVPFVTRSLDEAGIKREIPANEFARIPAEGPAIVVANHPHGFLDGLLLGDLIGQVRPDFKFLANHLLARMPEMAPLIYPMDPFGGEAAAKQNLKAMREAMKWLRDGHVIVLFPSGEVAPNVSRAGGSIDSPWQRTAGSLARRCKAPVVPLFILGANSRTFRLAGRIHPLLRTMLLPREFVRTYNRTFKMRVGHVIPAERMERFETDEELVDYMRLRTELLGRRPEGTGRVRRVTDLLARRRNTEAKQEPIIDAVPADELEAELASLPEDAHLIEAGRFQVYISRATHMPKVLREISRLREVTFREVGEGTGLAFDRDAFDETYLHLFVWDGRDRRIAGAYRLGESDKLLKQGGESALYTATLFSFDRQILDQLTPGLEMGRSFVTQEYQRNYMPLLLLWRGIAAHIARNPEYKLLFGPVSISADYKALSKDLMIDHLKAHRFVPELASGVRPRCPVKPPHGGKRFGLFWTDMLLGDVDEVSRMVADIEGEGRGVPVLLREYLKLGGKFIGFNRDPLFSNVVDGLVMVDLRQTEPRLLKRYFGEEAAAACFGDDRPEAEPDEVGSSSSPSPQGA